MKRTLWLWVGLLLLLASCNRGTSPDEIPTPITPEARLTEIVLTQNAPPPGFDTVTFPMIDDGLQALSGWRYEMTMDFKGVFARITRETSASTSLSVQYNQIATARRVVFSRDGDLFGLTEPDTYEAVRLGPDTFLVRDNQCLGDAGGDASIAADLRAGALIGGVTSARTAVNKAVINSEQVWLYDFSVDDLNLGSLRFGDDSQILAMSGALWVSPEHHAVVRYYLDLELENVTLPGSNLPVTGTLIIRYDLYEIGETPNISVPFGC